MRLLPGSIVIAIFVGLAGAQIPGNPDSWCREGFFTRDSKEFKLGRVRGNAQRKAFIWSGEGNPWREDSKPSGWLVGGDQLVINRDREGYSCVWFISKTGRSTIGWVMTSNLLSPQVKFDASTRAWRGEWTYGNNGIEFTEDKLPGNLNVTGNATWIGLNDNVHVGEIDGRYEPKNGVINYSDGEDEFDCKITMRLLGSYLIVADNLKCGGVNVTFSGIYTRKGK